MFTDLKFSQGRNAWSGEEHYKNATIISAFCAGMFSLVTTAIGLASMMTSSMGFVPAAVAGFAGSLGLQAAIFMFWGAAFTRARAATIPIVVAIAIVASLASAVLASGGYRLAMDRAGFQASRDHEAFGPLIAVTDAQRKRDVAVAGSFTLLSEDMHALAVRETSVGDTCVGQAVERSCGPRCRMRQRLQADSASMSAVANGLSRDATNLLAEAGAIRSDAQWRGVWTKAANLNGDLRNAKLKAWVDQTSDGFRNGFVDPISGHAFMCRDPKTEEKLTAIRADLMATPAFPAEIPARPTTDLMSSAQQSIDIIWQSVLSALGWGPLLSEMQRSLSMTPFVISIAVELLVVACIFLSAIEIVGARPRIKRVARWMRRGVTPGLSDDERAALTRIDEVIATLTVVEPYGRYFVEPLTADDPEALKIAASIPDLLGLKLGTGPVPLCDASGPIANALAARMPGITNVRLWRFGTLGRRRARQLRSTLGLA